MAAVLRVGSKAAPQRAVQAAALVADLEVAAVLEAAEVLAMVVVAGAAQAADVSFFSTIWSVIMKTPSFLAIALTSTLALGSAAYAAGGHFGNAGTSGANAGGRAAAGSAVGAGPQSRVGNPGVGIATRTQAQTSTRTQAQTSTLTPARDRDQDKDQDKDQLRTRLQTPTADGIPAAGPGTGAGVADPKGIHTPGTGLTTTSTDVLAQ